MDLILLAMCIYIFILGILVGSFLNVCILRIPKGESVIINSSHCFSCNKKLKPLELVPIFSYLFLGGKCKGCKTKISMQYPLIELLNGVLWLLIFLHFDLTIKTLIYSLLTSTLLVITVIDARTKEIPIQTTVFIAILGVANLLLNLHDFSNLLLGFLVIPAFLLALFIISGGSAIGGGDIKLMLGAGLILGFYPSLLSFFIASALGSIIHIIRMKFFGASRELALGPYLAVGIFISLMWGEPIISWYISLILI